MRTLVLPLVAAVLAGTPAVAQDSSAAYRGRPDPSDRPRNTAPVDSAEAKRWMQRFAQCVVAGDPTGARQLLATSPGSADERDRLVRIAQQRANCLHHGKLRMQGNWMRGAIAEQLYLRAYPKPIKAPATPDAPLTARADAQKWPYQAYADCIVARNAPAADAMLRAEPGSAAEKSALQQTMPTLSSCLAGGKDSKLAIDRTMLRGYLAESLYAQRLQAG
jgi:hypothetical protein